MYHERNATEILNDQQKSKKIMERNEVKRAEAVKILQKEDQKGTYKDITNNKKDIIMKGSFKMIEHSF